MLPTPESDRKALRQQRHERRRAKRIAASTALDGTEQGNTEDKAAASVRLIGIECDRVVSLLADPISAYQFDSIPDETEYERRRQVRLSAARSMSLADRLVRVSCRRATSHSRRTDAFGRFNS